MTLLVEEPHTRVPAATPPPTRRTLSALLRRGRLDHRRTPLTWGGALGALSALVMAIYPSIRDAIDEVIGSYPAGLREAFGIHDMGTVEGYLHAEMFSLVVPLALGYFAIRASVQALAAAEERGWLDTVLSVPVPRRLLVAGTFAVTGLAAGAILVVVGLATWIAGALTGVAPDVGRLAAGTVQVWPLSLFFAGVAVLATGATRGSGRVTAIGAGALVAMYVFDVVGRMSDAAEPLRWLSAFRLYGAGLVDGFDAIGFAGLIAAALSMTAIGAELFARRDIRS